MDKLCIEKYEIESKTESDDTFIDMLKTRPTRKALIVMGIVFGSTAMVYYGIAYNAGKLPGNVHVNNACNSMVETIGNLSAMFAMSYIGRRTLTSRALIFAGVSCSLCGLLFHPSIELEIYAKIGRCLSFLGKSLVSACFAVLWIYACELYPTSVRSIGTATGSAAARIGAITAPFFLEIKLSWLPYLIFGAVAIGAGIRLEQ